MGSEDFFRHIAKNMGLPPEVNIADVVYAMASSKNEEITATLMLLGKGWHHSAQLRYYWNIGNNGPGGCLDDQTMQPLDDEEIGRRYNEYSKAREAALLKKP